MESYRFFVSYLHEDVQIAEAIAVALRKLGHRLFWDPKIEPSLLFRDVIQREISRTQFFLPLLTSDALRSTWVQQEIGYAIGANVRVVPIVFDTEDNLGMLEGREWLRGRRRFTPGDWHSLFEKQNWGRILRVGHTDQTAVYHYYNNEGDRSKAIEDAAQYVLAEAEPDRGGGAEKEYVRVFQLSPMTSFSISPNSRLQGPYDWCHFREQESLARLVEHGGGNLWIAPCYWRKGYRRDVHVDKAQNLRTFLADHQHDGKVNVVVEMSTSGQSELIVGDYWRASSVWGGKTREMISTWHSPTVLNYRERLEKEFRKRFDEQCKVIKVNHPGATSVEYAMTRLDCLIDKLSKQDKGPCMCNDCPFREGIPA
jgi:hypothetical protein